MIALPRQVLGNSESRPAGRSTRDSWKISLDDLITVTDTAVFH